MPPTIDTVLADALKLSDPERAELATVLPAPSLPADWQAEIARRVADMDAGRARFVAADAALAALAARIHSRCPRA